MFESFALMRQAGAVSAQRRGTVAVDRQKIVEMRELDQPNQVRVSNDERDPRLSLAELVCMRERVEPARIDERATHQIDNDVSARP